MVGPQFDVSLKSPNFTGGSSGGSSMGKVGPDEGLLDCLRFLLPRPMIARLDNSCLDLIRGGERELAGWLQVGVLSVLVLPEPLTLTLTDPSLKFQLQG